MLGAAGDIARADPLSDDALAAGRAEPGQATAGSRRKVTAEIRLTSLGLTAVAVAVLARFLSSRSRAVRRANSDATEDVTVFLRMAAKGLAMGDDPSGATLHPISHRRAS